MFLSLFCVVDLETSNGMMPAAGELIMQSRLLIMPGVEHAVQIIGVDLCLLVLKESYNECTEYSEALHLFT